MRNCQDCKIHICDKKPFKHNNQFPFPISLLIKVTTWIKDEKVHHD